MDLLHKKMDYKFQIMYNNIPCIYYKEIKDIHDEYLMLYTNVVIGKKSIEDLLEILVFENIIDKMDKLFIKYVKKDTTIRDYNNTEIDLRLSQLVFKFCSICQGEMLLSYDNIYYECTDCYIIEPRNQIHEQILPRSKIGNFNPERHFKTWIDRILAREPLEEICKEDDPQGEKIINTIREYLVGKRKSNEHLTIDDIRNILKEIGRTQLNRNTSLIAKKITGRSPPKLDENKYNKIYTLFLKVMEARDHIAINNRCNRIYYPYYISKLLSLFLTTPEERKILNYIHLHKESTLSSNDQEWQEICNVVPELKGKYKPTLNSSNRYI